MSALTKIFVQIAVALHMKQILNYKEHCTKLGSGKEKLIGTFARKEELCAVGGQFNLASSLRGRAQVPFDLYRIARVNYQNERREYDGADLR